MPSVVAPIVLDGAFPVNRGPSRVRLIRHVSWRVSHLVAPGDFRLYWLSGCRFALNLYLMCLCFGAVSCVRRASSSVIRIQWAPPITRRRTPGLTKPVVLLLSCVLLLPFDWNAVGANSGSKSIDSPAVTTAAKSYTAAHASSSSKAARASSSSTAARASSSSTAARASSSSTAALKSSSSTVARASTAAANSPKAGPGREGPLLPPKSPERRYVAPPAPRMAKIRPSTARAGEQREVREALKAERGPVVRYRYRPCGVSWNSIAVLGDNRESRRHNFTIIRPAEFPRCTPCGRLFEATSDQARHQRGRAHARVVALRKRSREIALRLVGWSVDSCPRLWASLHSSLNFKIKILNIRLEFN